MSQQFAFFSDDQDFELLKALEPREKQTPEARFALDSELAQRPAHQKLHQRLPSKARAEKRRYFAQEDEAKKGLKAERLFSRSQDLKVKLYQKKGAPKS